MAPTTWGPLIAAACVWNVVEATGQPCPVPLRFCSVTVAALMRMSWDVVELSTGKEIGTDGLLTTWPAATLAFRLWICQRYDENYAERDAKDVCVYSYLNEGRTIRRAGAWDLDGLSVGPVRAITITGTCVWTHQPLKTTRNWAGTCQLG